MPDLRTATLQTLAWECSLLTSQIGLNLQSEDRIRYSNKNLFEKFQLGVGRMKYKKKRGKSYQQKKLYDLDGEKKENT